MNNYQCQVEKLLKKCTIKRSFNQSVIDFYLNKKDFKKADEITHCATYMGFTNVGGVAHVVKANFCRNRLCFICAWRRQAKFFAQMLPVLNELRKAYRFVFVTLTIKNVTAENTRQAVGDLLEAYNRFYKLRRVERAFFGAVRSVELTYNEKDDTFHPHIHMLAAVKKDYFNSEDYISLDELIKLWKKAARLDYEPNVKIQAVRGQKRVNGALEAVKYAMKPSKHAKALEVFDTALRGRRLVSFSGIIAQLRKQFRFSDLDDIERDDDFRQGSTITYDLYKFDVSGGAYTFIRKYTETL